MKAKISLKWPKREKDWVVSWPEWKNRSAKILASRLLDMIREFENYENTSLKELINDAGFDPTSFKISISEK